MTPRFIHICAASALAFTTGCAGSYQPIQPKKLATYISSPSSGPIDLAYQFDALRLNGGNKKYLKKEAQKGYHVAAVQLTNKSDREVNFSRDLVMFLGDRSIVPVPAAQSSDDLKQGVAIYLLYILLNPQITTTSVNSSGITQNSTFIPVGPFIAAGNILGASAANANMRKEFAAYDLTNRIIKPGETVYGIVSLRERAVAPLRIELSTRPTTPAAVLPAATPTNLPAPGPR